MNRKLKITLGVFLALVSVYTLWKTFNNNSYFLHEAQLRHQNVIHLIPNELNFAGEEVHFKTPQAYQRYYKELKLNVVNNSSSRLLIKNASKYLPVIEKILIANKIPRDFKYLAVAESHLVNDVVSKKGAAGIWQFTPPTAQALGLKINDEVDERLHIIKSTKAACKYLKMAYKKFGSWTSAAASYNRGMGGFEKALNNQNVNSFYDLNLNKETAKYIYAILSFKEILSHPRKYKLRNIKSAAVDNAISIKVDSTIYDLASFAKKNQVSIPQLREYNPWLIGNKLHVENGSSYWIRLPKNANLAIPGAEDKKESKLITMELK